MENNLTFDLMYLEQLAIKRSAKLERIAHEEMMRFDRDCEKAIDPVRLVKISHDNTVTDVEIAGHFKGYRVQSHELHTRACENSGIAECICLANKGEGSSIL